MIDDATKQEIYEAARATFIEWYGEELMTSKQGCCLYWNQVAMRELAMRGYTPLLMAGTMLWRIVPKEQDDGITATHFGFEWSPTHPFSVAMINQGLLPEVHIWCAVKETYDLVDFSTGDLPEVGAKHGHVWRTERPPRYLFGAPPEDASYNANVPATRYIWRFILEKLAGRPDLAEKQLAVMP